MEYQIYRVSFEPPHDFRQATNILRVDGNTVLDVLNLPFVEKIRRV
jgi:hypothetical protein